MTGEDLGYKPSVLQQKKFDYSPLGKIFTKGISKDAQKEGLFKRLENIERKNEELLKEFTTPMKLVRLLKMRVCIIMTLSTLFTSFTETLKILREWHQWTLNTEN